MAVDGTVVIDDFVPGSLANISSFAGQTLNNVTVTDDDSGDVLIGPVASLVVPDSGSHSIVAHLDASGTPTLTTFANDTSDTAQGEARFTLRHTAGAPAIDMILGDQRPITNLTNPNEAELELPDGELTDAQIAPTGDIAIAQIATLDLAANTNTIVYVVGSTADDTIDFVVQIVDFAVAPPPSTTTTSVTPTAVNTGAPIGGTSGMMLAVVALGGLTLAGGAMVARRRV
ncbi:MAG: DUF4397 domain-containing protein [Ilumatobacter sp.]|nr:DUF4397 domain-containing protein [Ilumatobacter sp.]